MSVKHPGSGLQWRRDGAVARITLDRPERRNAFDDSLAAALHSAVRDARQDETCRVILIDGAGPAFCAGWDLDSVADLRSLPATAIARRFEANRLLLEELEAAPQATVAAVHGAVMGFGLSLVASCDIAVAAASTLVALPEIAHAVVPALVMVDLLEILPEKQALDWLLTGEQRTAHDALAVGLVSRVVPDDRLATEVDALAQRLAGYDPEAVRETTALYRRLRRLEHDAAVREAIRSAVVALADAGLGS